MHQETLQLIQILEQTISPGKFPEKIKCHWMPLYIIHFHAFSLCAFVAISAISKSNSRSYKIS